MCIVHWSLSSFCSQSDVQFVGMLLAFRFRVELVLSLIVITDNSIRGHHAFIKFIRQIHVLKMIFFSKKNILKFSEQQSQKTQKMQAWVMCFNAANLYSNIFLKSHLRLKMYGRFLFHAE